MAKLDMTLGLFSDKKLQFESAWRLKDKEILASFSFSSLLKPHNKKEKVKYCSNCVIEQEKENEMLLKLNDTTREKRTIFHVKYEERIKTNYQLVIKEY